MIFAAIDVTALFVALIGLIGVMGAAIISTVVSGNRATVDNGRKVAEIKLLVNGRLDKALTEIETLRSLLEHLTGADKASIDAAVEAGETQHLQTPPMSGTTG